MSKKAASKSKPVNTNPDFQDRDISLHALVIFTVIVFGTTLLAFIGMAWMYKSSEAKRAAEEHVISPLALKRDIPTAGPLLQVNADQDLADLHAAEEKQLTTYGWVDEKAHVVHIPIAQAMQQYIEEQKAK